MSNNNKLSIHNGHRERLKKRFRANLGKDFQDHELLEMLLFYVIPRVNTNELAHRLIDEFGSLRNLCCADPNRIEKVAGAGVSTATFISLLFALKKRIDLQKYDMNKFNADKLTNVGEYLLEYYKDREYEEVCAMLLDSSYRLIDFVTISVGSVNTSCIDIKSLVKYSLSINATQVILAHNHPHGEASPSIQDKEISFQIEKVLKVLDISLVEHIIVGDVSYAPTMYMRTNSTNRIADINKYKSFYED